jgi:hypothetical protein
MERGTLETTGTCSELMGLTAYTLGELEGRTSPLSTYTLDSQLPAPPNSTNKSLVILL